MATRSAEADPDWRYRTEYCQHDRKRDDSRSRSGYRMTPDGPTVFRDGPPTAFIWRCDLKTTFFLNLDDREYQSAPMRPARGGLQAGPPPTAPPELPKPTFVIETTTVDTGERKDFFGFDARHVIVTRSESPLEGGTRPPSETVTDGWYIDLPVTISCLPDWGRSFPHAYGVGRVIPAGQPHDARWVVSEFPTFKDVGPLETGYPIEMRMESHSTFQGQVRTHVTEYRVTALSRDPLDPNLFEIPAGFRRVAQIRQEPDPPPRKDPPFSWTSLWDRLRPR